MAKAKTAKKTTAAKTSSKKQPQKTASKTKAATKVAVKKTSNAKTKPAAKKAAKTAPKKTVTFQKKPAQRQAPKPKAKPTTFLQDMETIMSTQPFDFDKIAQEAANQSREGFEALSKSGSIFAKGYEELIKTAASFTQTAVERQAEYAKQLMGVKSINEYADKQNKIAQESYEQFMENATKLSELSVKVLSDASEPLNSQITKTMSKAGKKAA